MLALGPRSLASFALLCLASAGGAQTTWYVDGSAVPPGDGSQASPYSSIQYALAQPETVDGDTVLVLPGTYVENVDFLGKAVRLVSSGGRTVTVIDGGGAGVGLSAVTFASGEGRGSVLQGFTVTNGWGALDAGMVQTEGGGVRIVGASPMIRDCLLEQNSADHGGALSSQDGNPRIEDCILSNNIPTGTTSGAGAWFTGGAPWLVDVEVMANDATNWGGGLYFEGSLPSLLRVSIHGNVALYGEGGGVYLSGCPLASFVDCSVSGNGCLDGGWGAGLAAVSSTVTMTGCRVEGNFAFVDHAAGGIGLDQSSLWFSDGEILGNFSADGGGIGTDVPGGGNSTLWLEHSTVAGNTAQARQAGSGSGGGLNVDATSSATVKRCLFDSNSASSQFGGQGGAVFGPAVLEHCTLVSNTADDVGGACGASLDSCIAYFNTPIGTCSSAWVIYSDVEGGHPGTGNIDADPLFWNMAGGDFHLLQDSPCIDAGNPSSALDPDGTRADMGAFPFDAGYCPAPVNYCTAGTSAAGCQATIASIGTPSATAPNGFVLLASGVESQREGLFFFGTNGRQANSWGSSTSFQCVVPPAHRGKVLDGVGAVGECEGTFSYDLNAHWTVKPHHNPGPGVLLQAQLWYRDWQSTSNQTTALSDALEVGVCP